MRVVVTRPAAEGRAWCLALQQAGFDVAALPLIAISALDENGRAALRRAWSAIDGYRAAMFVSAASVQHFFDEAPPGWRWPQATRAWAPGPGTAAVLLKNGVPPEAVDTPAPDAGQLDSEALWAAAGHRIAPGDAVLIVRGAQQDQGDASGAGHGRAWMAERLAAAGAVVTQLAAYRRGAPAWSADEAAAAAALAGPATAWVFSNSEAIGHLVALFQARPGASAALLQGSAVATHPRIATSALAAGFVRVEAARPGIEGVADALRRLDPSIESTG